MSSDLIPAGGHVPDASPQPALLAEWYDSAEPHDRRESLRLWRDGTLTYCARREPGDVWPPARYVVRVAGDRSMRTVAEWSAAGKGWTFAMAQEEAASLGLLLERGGRCV